jgi:hypothetical protein
LESITATGADRVFHNKVLKPCQEPLNNEENPSKNAPMGNAIEK